MSHPESISLFEKNWELLRQRGVLLHPLPDPSTLVLPELRVAQNQIHVLQPSRECILRDDLNPKRFENENLTVIYGMGTGELLTRLVGLPQIKQLIVFEAHAGYFLSLISLVDFSALFSSPKVKIIVGDHTPQSIWNCCKSAYDESADDAAEFFKPSFFVNSSQTLWDNIETSTQIFKEGVDLYLDELMGFSLNVILDPFYGLSNTIRNAKLHFESPHLHDVGEIHSGKPGVVVGMGPSLDASLPLLKEHQDRLVICVVDVALQTLLRAGIRPDYVVSQERLGCRDWFDATADYSDIHLVVPMVVQPLVTERYPGPMLRISLTRDFDFWFGGQYEPEPRGTLVSHMAYSTLAKLGCDPICLIGNDLSYDPVSGRGYSEEANLNLQDTASWLKKEMFASRILTVNGFDGTRLTTSPLWDQSRWIFADFVKHYGKATIQIFPSGYGIPIPGALRMTPDEFKSRVAKVSPVKVSPVQLIAEKGVQNHFNKNLASAEIHRASQALLHYQKVALSVLHELDEFVLSHNVTFVEEYRQMYEDFFVHIMQIQASLSQHSSRFFNTHFMTLFWPVQVRVGVNLARIHFQERDFIKSANQRIYWLYHWFQELHLWSSRVLTAMDKNHIL